MALHRHTRSIDGTIPVPALLYDDEDNIASQDGVGIYDGLQKAPEHQNGTITITTHRLFYTDAHKPYARSFALDLAAVARTDYYAGLFTSSPKVTLYLNSPAASSAPSSEDATASSWTCEVCSFRNPPGTSLAAAKCSLCGVPRVKGSASTTSASNAATTSLPTTPSHTPAPREAACPACTFLNHPSLSACEICGTPLAPAKSAPASRPATPPPSDAGAVADVMKLSFRKGGDKTLYAALRRSLLGKAWEVKSTRTLPSSGAQSSGINGLIRTAASSAQSRTDDMAGALHDLETLMVKAREMIRLSAELNEKLTALSSVAPPPSSSPSSSLPNSAYAPATLIPPTQTQTASDAATFIRGSLVQLGLHMEHTPVTLDMIRDEKRWHAELARELAGVLGGFVGDGGGRRGIVGMDEVWGGWNRARGVALIPPPTFLQVLPHLPPSLQTRTFPSGLKVLHTPSYAPSAFLARVRPGLPMGALEVAAREGISVALAGEMMGEAEGRGEVCREEGEVVGWGAGVGAVGDGGFGGEGEGAGEVRWWPNVFEGYVWDGQEDP